LFINQFEAIQSRLPGIQDGALHNVIKTALKIGVGMCPMIVIPKF
jgi:hypothetical protein